ncbi:hypothetical protein [Pseudomonas aeruginosa]|uniref:hypothetical protein n=1 Tax=Pseudomonas aeruginosa TaxID=287 RepID=UPI0011BE5BF0|nr:hypothetical protein [Pseudomonas aeruginosa]MCO1759682.1 hypothetical protein [Pseudomonas aeruginosa]MCS7936208.1 hypothetical protein [Pseudomonas aeruginosa]MCV4034355.1 hypothetical protein [Pseudomonas aeruginosa]QYE72362.1 hypothetical protein KZ798_03770 [Pseudomonas aeruginosa]HCF2668531.1 hypothetical protein [Pseudomonas aeruginosa]
MTQKLMSNHAQHVLAMLPDYSILSTSEVAQLECAAEIAYQDRGGRPVFNVDALPERLANQIYAWGRIAPDVVIDEVAEAIDALRSSSQS